MGVEREFVTNLPLQEGLALVTLRRSGKRNAVNPQLAHELEATVREIEEDPSIKVAILTGEGDVFSAGADLAEVARGNLDLCFLPESGFAGFVNAERSKPWIAAVNGPAFAGGCEIALACDIIVASNRASFALPEVRRGLIASAGGLYRLPCVLPRSVALEMILTGNPLQADRAYALGLVSRLCEPDALLSEAETIAAAIAANAPLAVRESLRLARLASGFDNKILREHAEAAQDALQRSADYQEGSLAFVEKRVPQWRGS